MNRNNAYDLNSDDGDLLSDDDESCLYSSGDPLRSGLSDKSIPSAADRRAHHNALERKRRDHIKDSFSSLRDSVPSLQGEKASRAQILKKAAEYIQFMRKKNTTVQTDIDKIAHENKALEEQIRLVESQGGLNGSGISLSSQSLSLLTSEPTDVSSSYDISENSNESASNDLSPSPPMNGRNHHNGLDKSIVNNSEQLLINGTNSVVRSAVVKNGTNTIIVQNPQLKSNSHVIHVTTTGHNNSSNISSSSSTSTPLIISTLPNVKSTGGAGSVGGNAGSGSNGNSYIINKTTNTILSNGYQAVMVQPSSTNSSTGGTTTPNIHIVNSIPSSYSGRTKRFKISTGDSDSASSVVVAAAAATGNGSTTQSSFNVTSVSS